MQKKNNDGKIVLILVIAIIAFTIGAVIGVSMSFNLDVAEENNTTHEENVTELMTSNASNSKQISFLDFNFDNSNFLYIVS